MSCFSGTDLVQSLISHLNYFSKHLLHLPFYSLSLLPCCQSAVSKYKSVFLSSTVRAVCFLRIMIYKSVHYPSLACLPNFLLHYTTHTHTHTHPTMPWCTEGRKAWLKEWTGQWPYSLDMWPLTIFILINFSLFFWKMDKSRVPIIYRIVARIKRESKCRVFI